MSSTTAEPAPAGTPQPSRPRWVLRITVALLVVALAAVAFVITIYAQAEYHFRAGQRAMARRDFAEARRHFNACRATRSSDPDVHLLAARATRRAAVRAADYEEAEQLLRRCHQLNAAPEATALEWSLLRVQRGDLQEADRLLKRAKELPADSPEPVLIYEAVARGLMRTYRMLDAERCLSLWLEREPQNSQALLWRGWVRKNGFENEAIPIDYVEAVKADEENDDARLRLAEELMTRKPDEALVHFQKLRQRLPENLEAAVGEALCYKDLARKDDAQARLDALLTPERLRLIGEVSDAILKGRPLDHPVTRMPWYENTIALAPFESRYQPRYVIDLLCRSLIERADLEMQDGKDADAERDLREAVKLDPFDYKGTYKLSVCLNRQRRKDEATATMDRASQLAKGAERLKVVSRQILQNPLDPAARAEAGKLCMDSGHPEQAVRWLESALQIDPNNQDARRTLDEFYQRAGSKGAGR